MGIKFEIYDWFVQVTINLMQEHANSEKVRSNAYHFSGGLNEYVLWLNNDKVPFYRLHEFVSAGISLSWSCKFESSLPIQRTWIFILIFTSDLRLKIDGRNRTYKILWDC